MSGILLSVTTAALAALPAGDITSLDDLVDRQPAVDVTTDDVASVDVLSGRSFDPDDAPWPELRPRSITVARLTGTVDEMRELLACGTVSTCTPEMERATDEEWLVFRIRFVGFPAEAPPSYGVNVNVDVNPTVEGRFFSGAGTPADCGLAANLGGGRLYLTTTRVSDPGTGAFAELPAPMAARLGPTGGTLVIPLGHPCAGGRGFQASTYVLAGLGSSVEHATPPSGVPFMPFPQVAIAVGAPPPTTAAPVTTRPTVVTPSASVAPSRPSLPSEAELDRLDELADAADALQEGDLGEDDSNLALWLGVAVAGSLAAAVIIWWWMLRRRRYERARELAEAEAWRTRVRDVKMTTGGGSTQLDPPAEAPRESILDEIDEPAHDAMLGGTGAPPEPPKPPEAPPTIVDEIIDAVPEEFRRGRSHTTPPSGIERPKP